MFINNIQFYDYRFVKDLGYMDCHCKGLRPVMWNLVKVCDMFVSVKASTECLALIVKICDIYIYKLLAYIYIYIYIYI